MIGRGGRLLIATRNRGKTAEFRRAFAELGIDVADLNETAGMPEVEETGATFADNALLKARAVAERSGLPALADDSGLCVDALGGAPGVYSARYAGEGAGDAANNAKLLRELAAGGAPAEALPAAAAAPRLLSPARFVCSLALYDPADGSVIRAEGTVEGWIADEPRGSGGFGYDPLFWLPELGCSMSELPVDRKNAISHRGAALRRLLAQLQAT